MKSDQVTDFSIDSIRQTRLTWGHIGLSTVLVLTSTWTNLPIASCWSPTSLWAERAIGPWGHVTPKVWKVYVRKRKKGNPEAEVAW